MTSPRRILADVLFKHYEGPEARDYEHTETAILRSQYHWSAGKLIDKLRRRGFKIIKVTRRSHR